MYTLTTQSTLFAPRLALASSGVGEDLTFQLQQYVSFADSLAADLNAQVKLADLIKDNQNQFHNLRPIAPLADQYAILQDIFSDADSSKSKLIMYTLGSVIEKIYEKTQERLTPDEYWRIKDSTPTPPATIPNVTEQGVVSFFSDPHTLVSPLLEEPASHADTERVGPSALILSTIKERGEQLRAQGNYQAAIKVFTDGIVEVGERPDELYWNLFYLHLGESYRLAGKSQEAVICLTRTLDYYDRQGDKSMAAIVRLFLSLANSDLKEWKEAESYGSTAMEMATAMQDSRLQAMAHHSLARAYYGKGEVKAALAASTQSFELLEKLKMIGTLDKDIRIWQALCLKAAGNVIEATRLVDQVYLSLRGQAQFISSDARVRNRFLHDIPTHQLIYETWKNLGGYAARHIKQKLDALQWNIGEQDHELTRFVDHVDYLVKLDGSLSRPDYPWDGKIAMSSATGRTLAGVVVDRSLANVVSSIVSKPIQVPENYGVKKKAKAVGIALHPLFDTEAEFYLFAAWKMRLRAGLQRWGLLEALGYRKEYKHLLKGDISEENGLVVITLDNAVKETVIAADGETYSAPYNERPTPEDLSIGQVKEFGRVRFIFEALDEGKTRLVIEFENAEFSVNPDKFMRAVLITLDGG